MLVTPRTFSDICVLANAPLKELSVCAPCKRIKFPLFQVKQRADECIRALDILFDINSGKSVENVLQCDFDLSTMEVNITISLNSISLVKIENCSILFCGVLMTMSLPAFQNSMDLCRIAIMGHSFGGATVIECLCKDVKFKYVLS